MVQTLRIQIDVTNKDDPTDRTVTPAPTRASNAGTVGTSAIAGSVLGSGGARAGTVAGTSAGTLAGTSSGTLAGNVAATKAIRTFQDTINQIGRTFPFGNNFPGATSVGQNPFAQAMNRTLFGLPPTSSQTPNRPTVTNRPPTGSVPKTTPNVAGNISKGTGALRNPAGFIGGIVSGIIANPAVLTVLAIAVFSKLLLDKQFDDGGPFDRRFRPIIERQIIATLSREQIREIRRGNRVFRASAGAGQRARPGSFNSNLAEINRGNRLLVEPNEIDNKGVI